MSTISTLSDKRCGVASAERNNDEDKDFLKVFDHNNLTQLICSSIRSRVRI